MHFQGYNTGTVISSVLLPAASAVWTMSFADKKLLYGKLRVAVGGNSGENDDEDEEDEGDPACDVDVPPTTDASKPKPSTRGPENMEPVTFNSMPISFYEDLYDAMNLKDIYDITPCDGCAAMAALNLKLGYIGVCFTDFHVERLNQHILEMILKAFETPGHPHFQSSYAAGALGIKSHSAKPTGSGGDPKPIKPGPTLGSGPTGGGGGGGAGAGGDGSQSEGEPKRKPRGGKKRKRNASESESGESGNSH